jgi:hypothetical protein
MDKAAHELLKFWDVTQMDDTQALFRHLNILLIFVATYNSDVVGFPILP